MSRLITNTNIIVDDFDFSKSFPKNTFHHFLTHFHSDHYQGLTPLWDYGAIYCSHQTKKFILHKYPKIQNIHSYDCYQQNTIEIVNGLKVSFWFFDAKHIPGSVMIFFKGYMGSILFTGDFRYQFNMVLQNQRFFPKQNRDFHVKQQIIQKMEGISLHVDQMIFDNTYCNRVFSFQTEIFIANKIIKIISDNSKKKLVLIAMGALGKHRILLKIAQYFQTTIIVSEKQLQKITVAGLRTDFLSTQPQEGFIHLISKKNRSKMVQQTKKSSLGDSFICIDTDFLMLQHQSPDQINYIVPYSLHSNYEEMQKFVRMIKPSILRKIVIPFANFRQIKLRIKIDHRLKFARYLDFLTTKLEKSQSGYSQLVRHYTAIYELSEDFLRWFSKNGQKYLMNLLSLGDGQQNHNLRKRKPILIDESQFNFKSNSQSQSLKSIADNLNAVNKNLTLEKCFQQGQQKRFSKKYDNKMNEYIQKQTTQKSKIQEDYQIEQQTQSFSIPVKAKSSRLLEKKKKRANSLIDE